MEPNVCFTSCTNSNFSFGTSFFCAINFTVLNKLKQGTMKTGNVNRLIKFGLFCF